MESPVLTQFNLVMQGSESTVVSEYTPTIEEICDYQSEDALEGEFIRMLQDQAYEYLPITNEQDLIANLRTQLEKLNHVTFSDSEWNRFFTQNIVNQNEGIEEKAHKIHDAYIQLLIRDDGTSKNIYLINPTNIHENTLQVINQYEAEGARKTRYDVTILVNGIPMVHIELKRRGVELREAFNQIDRYQRDSFWADSGLFEYIQVFVISNGTHTKYYSNTTREQHITEDAFPSGSRKKTSNSFKFTSWWADATNKPIPDLVDFTKTFFAKHTILNILTRYTVFTSEKLLLVMRPYQIVATERILKQIAIATNYKRQGTIDAGGYIWHTTGSGKTLTSFKTAQLATRLPGIDKVLFVVDRKDLDYQTMKEYDRFEKGAANSNTSTRILKVQLEDSNARIIVTTIQKLSRFIVKNQGHEIYGKNIVIIFDEAHRSQFGEMHTAITKAFKKYFLFGFTGTPIFSANTGSMSNPNLHTTAQTFGRQLHTYTIVDAISDGNVLPFRIDYVRTIRAEEDIDDIQVKDIEREQTLMAPERISEIVSYIIEQFDRKTVRDRTYWHKGTRVKGFNSLFATASIEAAKRYYAEFKRQQQGTTGEKLKIGIIYSYAPNEELPEGQLAEEDFEAKGLDKSSRDFLDEAIKDYNTMFGVNYNAGDQFENYYKDISHRLKNRDLDMVIVVNMFLTGFDATTLNTLWVDKKLRSHGLIQAFSRTNRILNSVKSFGNIVCFRNLEKPTEEAIALFGDKEAAGIVVLKPFDEYYGDYEMRIAELVEGFPLGAIIVSENDKKRFIKLFGSILRLRNILRVFDEFEGKEILTPRELQNYQSVYLDIYQEMREAKSVDEKESIIDDVVFEVELIKQIEVNIDYILELVAKYHNDNCQDREILVSIGNAVDSSLNLRSKKDLILAFVDSLTVDSDVLSDWIDFVEERYLEELNQIISEENLSRREAVNFMNEALMDGEIKTTGLGITKVLPPTPKFGRSSSFSEKKDRVIEKLSRLFERFYGIG